MLKAALRSGAFPASPVWPLKRSVSVSVFPCWTSAAVSVPSPCQWECPCVNTMTSRWGQNYLCCGYVCVLKIKCSNLSITAQMINISLNKIQDPEPELCFSRSCCSECRISVCVQCVVLVLSLYCAHLLCVQGTLCSDCLYASFCPHCVWCQMSREMKKRKLPTVLGDIVHSQWRQIRAYFVHYGADQQDRLYINNLQSFLIRLHVLRHFTCKSKLKLFCMFSFLCSNCVLFCFFTLLHLFNFVHFVYFVLLS